MSPPAAACSSASTPWTGCAGEAASGPRRRWWAARWPSSRCCTWRRGGSAPLEKVRTTARAAQRMVELAVRAAGDGPADLAVHHLGAAERAEELAERLRERLPRVARLLVSEVGAVIGAHAGTGLLGIVVVRRRDGARR